MTKRPPVSRFPPYLDATADANTYLSFKRDYCSTESCDHLRLSQLADKPVPYLDDILIGTPPYDSPLDEAADHGKSWDHGGRQKHRPQAQAEQRHPESVTENNTRLYRREHRHKDTDCGATAT